jgi:hypothetical protein
MKPPTGSMSIDTIDLSGALETVAGHIYIMAFSSHDEKDQRTEKLLRQHGGERWRLDSIQDGMYRFVSVASDVSFTTALPREHFITEEEYEKIDS